LGSMSHLYTPLLVNNFTNEHEIIECNQHGP